jgi:hypothetical protein
MNDCPVMSAYGAGEIAHVVETVRKSLDDVFVRRCVDVIVTLCQIYGFDDQNYSRKRTYDHWIGCAADSGLHPMKFVKWKLSAFYAYHKSALIQQTIPGAEPLELPEALPGVLDNPSTLLTGKGYRWINYLRRKNPTMFDSFITSVLRAKTGMPRPGKALLRAEEQSTFRDLTTDETIRPSCVVSTKDGKRVVETVVRVADFQDELRRTVRDIFGGQTYTQDDRIRPFMPSTSANYINSRSGLGAIGSLKDDTELWRGLTSKEELISVTKEVTGKKQDVVFKVWDYPLKERFHRLYNRVLSRAYREIPVAVPLGLAEALKVRVITKGPAFTYTALKPLQRKMWSILSSLKTFELTGTPVTPLIVNRRMGKLRDDEDFISADYKNATNDMMSWASETVVQAISDELALPQEERELFIRAMTQHVIENPETKERKPQKHGQLMGSVVSFIVLCVVNATICRMAIEASRGQIGRLTLDACRMLINGDDAVFRSNAVGYRNWEILAAFVGMKPSIGKVYRSKHFLNINSTTYNYHADGFYSTREKELVRFEHVKSVNLGLMFGLKRSGGKTDAVDEGPTSLGARARALVSDAPSELSEELVKRFIRGNHDALTTVNLPWFIPETLGGVGLPEAGSYCADDLTLRLCRKIHDHPDKFRLPAKPSDTPWKMWQYAQKRFRFHESDLSAASQSNSISTVGVSAGLTSVRDIQNLFCVEALFRGVDLYDSTKAGPSYEKLRRSDQLKYLRLKSRVWTLALHDSTIPLPEPYRSDNFPPPVPSLDLQKILHYDTGHLRAEAFHGSHVGFHSGYLTVPQHGQGRKPLCCDGSAATATSSLLPMTQERTGKDEAEIWQ